MKAVSKMDRITKDSTVAFVHAKGHSERLPGKNLRLLGGIPLACHAIRNALAAKEIDHVVIDSDSDEILAVGEEAGAIPLKRPDFLATNVITGDDLAYWQAWNAKESAIIVQVVPTSPFVLPESIDSAVKQIGDAIPDFYRDVTGVIGVLRQRIYRWEDGKPAYYRDGRIPNSDDLQRTTWETTGLYVIRTNFALAHRRRIAPARECRFQELSHVEAIDINEARDFAFAEIIMKGVKAC